MNDAEPVLWQDAVKIPLFPRWKDRGRDLRGRKVRSIFGLPVMWKGGSRVVWRKCAECTGGSQLLDLVTGKWGRIPLEMRREMGDEVGIPRGNIRKCPACHGTGKHWVPVK